LKELLTMQKVTYTRPATKTLRASRTNRGQRRQRGWTLIELGLALLITGMLIMASVILYVGQSRKASIQNNVQQIQSLASAAKATYGQQNLYGQVNTAVAVQGHVIPESLRDGQAATATNNFGSAIAVVAGNGTGINDILVVTWGNVPADQCSDIVAGVVGSVRRVTVGAAVVKPLDGALGIAALNVACEVNNVNGTVDLSLAVGRS
jgi:type II secretory pathway pseudopilin PulG